MLTPGSLLQNRYQIIRLLGQGGMGAVYQANDLRLSSVVAVKENVGGNPQQFQQEAFLLANLTHPNLPRVMDHFDLGAAQYLVMDYIAGDDLDAVIARQGALPEAQVLAWFDQILDAVAYLHARGIIHRDIKPANIKITPQGQAVLVDFGIAKMYQPGRATQTGARAATPGFASPEQYRGGTDARSDVYSLGATLYALLTAQTPPDALSLVGRSAMLMPPRSLNPAIRAQTEQVILRAMMLAPHQRFQNVNEMRWALRGAPTVSAPITRTTAAPVRAPGRLRPSIVISLVALGMLCIALVAGVGLVGWALSDLATPTRMAIAPTRAPTLIVSAFTPTRIAVALTRTPTLIISAFTPTRSVDPPTSTPVVISGFATATPPPSRSARIAFVSDRDGNREIYVMNEDGSGLRNLTNHPAEDGDPAWSPDGRSIAFTSKRDGNFKIYVMNADGSNARRLTNQREDDWKPTWSPDGTQIAFVSSRTGNEEIFVMNADGSNPRNLTNRAGDDGAPAWSPNGRFIAFASERDGNWEIYVMNADGTNPRRLTNHPEVDFAPAWSPDSQRIAFHSHRDGNSNVYVLNVDGTGLRRLTANSYEEGTPAWSSDGRFIVFESKATGNFDIFIMMADGTNARNLTQHPAEDIAPTWSP